MIGWHHPLNGHEFKQTLGDGEGQGRLACCSSWGGRVGHNLATEQQGATDGRSYMLQLRPSTDKYMNKINTKKIYLRFDLGHRLGFLVP